MVAKGREKRNRLARQQESRGLHFRPLRNLLVLSVLAGATGFALYEGWLAGASASGAPPVSDHSVAEVRRVLLHGEVRHVDSGVVVRLVREAATEGLLALDLTQLRNRLEALPWVYRARVRKQWPESVEVWLQEQRAMVAWGEEGYLNRDGNFFGADGIQPADLELPVISSREGETEAVYRKFSRLSMILGDDVENGTAGQIRRMVVDQRGAVTLTLGDGVELNLGRRFIEERLRRWRAQSPGIMGQLKGRVRKVDLRYGQGAAIDLAP